MPTLRARLQEVLDTDTRIMQGSQGSRRHGYAVYERANCCLKNRRLYEKQYQLHGSHTAKGSFERGRTPADQNSIAVPARCRVVAIEMPLWRACAVNEDAEC